MSPFIIIEFKINVSVHDIPSTPCGSCRPDRDQILVQERKYGKNLRELERVNLVSIHYQMPLKKD